LADKFTLCATPFDTLKNADALVLATNWPEYASIQPQEIFATMRSPVIIDISRFLLKTLGNDSRLRYFAIGKN